MGHNVCFLATTVCMYAFLASVEEHMGFHTLFSTKKLHASRIMVNMFVLLVSKFSLCYLSLR